MLNTEARSYFPLLCAAKPRTPRSLPSFSRQTVTELCVFASLRSFKLDQSQSYAAKVALYAAQMQVYAAQVPFYVVCLSCARQGGETNPGILCHVAVGRCFTYVQHDRAIGVQ